jgi:tellurium resistance protein TerD
MGDNLIGGGGGDDEQIKVNLAGVPAMVDEGTFSRRQHTAGSRI